MNIDLTMIFHTHGTAEDALKLRPYIEECDLLIPEIANWHWNFKLAIYQLSRGEISLEEFRVKFILPDGQVEDSYHGVFYRTLFENRRETLIMELPRSSEYISNKRWIEKMREVRKLFTDECGAEGLRAIRNLLSEDCAHLRKRELHLMENFEARITSRIRRSKRLSNKSTVNVLFVIGLGHEPIYEQIAPWIKGRCTKIVLDGHTEVDSYRNLKFAQDLKRKVISEDYTPNDEELIAYLFPKTISPSPSQ